jgi:hypothetical protein
MIGAPFTVPTFHRPLDVYFRALEDAGFLVEAVRELPTRRRARPDASPSSCTSAG